MGMMEPNAKPREGALELKSRFEISEDRQPDSDQLGAHANVRMHIESLAKLLNTTVEDSREKSLAITKLEEALMWAGKAIFK